MVTSLPVICSDAGGLNEMIHHKENGIKYKSGDLDSLYNGLYQMFSLSSDELNQLGRNARIMIQNKYTINISSQLYNTLYNSLD